jgi:hypothetical protein
MAGARYLRQLLDAHKGNVKLRLAEAGRVRPVPALRMRAAPVDCLQVAKTVEPELGLLRLFDGPQVRDQINHLAIVERIE